jgi:hypothetical protein
MRVENFVKAAETIPRADLINVMPILRETDGEKVISAPASAH